MKRTNRQGTLAWGLLAAMVVLVAHGGCTIKASTKTSTDGVMNFLSSTSGKAWFDQDGLVKEGENARAFAALNFDNLQQDMARGEGEYLATLGTLLGIPANQQPAFGREAQRRYPQLVTSDATTADDLLAALRRAHPAPAHE